MKKRLLTTTEAAEILGLLPDTVRRYCNSGRIKNAERTYNDNGIGNYFWMIPRASVENGIEKKKAGRPRKEQSQ